MSAIEKAACALSAARGLVVRIYETADFDALSAALWEVDERMVGRDVSQWEEALQFQGGQVWVAVREGCVVGCGGVTSHVDRAAYFHGDFIHPQHQRRGIGTALVLARFATLDEQAVECVRLEATPFSRPFYERFGFQQKGEPRPAPALGFAISGLEVAFGKQLSDEAFVALETAGVRLQLE